MFSLKVAVNRMSTHPYFPQDLVLDGVQPQALAMEIILATFFAVTIFLVGIAWAMSRSLTTAERCMAVWMLVSGGIHLIVEGAFALNGDFFKNSDPRMLLLELWKEYSKADSRYASRDSFVVSMETVTAFAWGPGCWLIVFALLAKSSWRWSAVIIVSVGQLYGDILYFATCWLEGGIHIRPEPLYFWFYFIFMNAIWIVVPVLCILYAVGKISEAVSSFEHQKVKAL